MARRETGSRSAATKSLVAAYSFSDPAVTGMRFADRSGTAASRWGGTCAARRQVRPRPRLQRQELVADRLGPAGPRPRRGDDAVGLGQAAVRQGDAHDRRPARARRRGLRVHAATAKGGPGGEARLARGTRRVSVPEDLPLGKWIHVALTYDGSRMRLYNNAGEVSSIPMTGSLRDANGPLRIGGRVPGGGWFKGGPRRGPRLQPRPQRGGDPARHGRERPVQPAPGGRTAARPGALAVGRPGAGRRPAGLAPESSSTTSPRTSRTGATATSVFPPGGPGLLRASGAVPLEVVGLPQPLRGHPRAADRRWRVLPGE